MKSDSDTFGILPIDKPANKTSFSLVSLLRKITHVKKIGHTGTLDPFATGVMILLIGKQYTRQCDSILQEDKEYEATVCLGISTDTYDTEGQIVERSSLIPTQIEVEKALETFQGTILQTPPMFSAKKVAGKKLYELARRGISIERTAVPVTLHITLLSYAYPNLRIHVRCSKGTYLRSLAYDIGKLLKCGAHLTTLTRTRNGAFTLNDCCDGARLLEPGYPWISFLRV